MTAWAGGAEIGAAVVAEKVASPPPAAWFIGVLNSVSWIVSILERPRRVSRSPKLASPARMGPGPRTRTLVREAVVGRARVWLVTAATPVGAAAATGGAAATKFVGAAAIIGWLAGAAATGMNMLAEGAGAGAGCATIAMVGAGAAGAAMKNRV